MPYLMNLSSGIWITASNGSLLLALLAAFGMGFAAGIMVLGYFNGKRRR